LEHLNPATVQSDDDGEDDNVDDNIDDLPMMKFQTLSCQFSN